MDLENFKEAFSANIGSCCAECICGRKFYNPDPSWDFEEGELERLRNNPKATSLDYSVGYIFLNGTECVIDCDCWHRQATAIMDFIDKHNSQIALYLTLEKKRKTREADTSPVVEG